METGKKWLYYNIHDLIGIRLQNDHPSKKSFNLFFGSFETRFLSEDEISLSIQTDVPEITEYSNASSLYRFNNNYLCLTKYNIHLFKKNNFWILASQRDLLTFVHPILQMLLLKKGCCMLHSASVAINGLGVLLPACGGTGKTSAIMHILKEIKGASFLSDDFCIISPDLVYSNPKHFAIYPYHKSIFPHLFNRKHKFLIPGCLSNLFEKIRAFVRPIIVGFSEIERFAKKIAPDRMYVPAREALGDVAFSDNAKIDTLLLLERYSGNNAVVENISSKWVRSRLIGNWLYEIGPYSQEMLTAMSGTGIIDLSEYFSQMSTIIDSACHNKTIKLLKLPKMLPQKTGGIITEILKEIMKTN
ncbi:MAG: hypothetical protein JW806_08995 [Sedimentisphaerales bacterium]|nr:hypothetical protein [Sedimentisphaerales bacterium]